MGAKVSKISAQEEARIAKKCVARRTAYYGCVAANKADPKACERLEAALVMCTASELASCKEASGEHERCFTSLMNTGRYNGRRDCTVELDALKAALKRHGAYPFPQA
ncbi:hypothetical protein MNEG_5659 [Monoraphidium neglectum]|uniref:Uncharacterized protein n=1 Tax=Monoraphidium neglectum TaxID=145388 RepID=A0A0D2JTQ3_9CHLO|nr:hypothetical protein MNEG_5659 [Monoraphidium neglectum]KIZ02298.1 hypothetical protein MNEG_5659 [Monoraphidium neglectum]|eukprot:XP_013901317.1 hypothetical protein MNEG_5659 [Monoraphidium neglectum]